MPFALFKSSRSRKASASSTFSSIESFTNSDSAEYPPSSLPLCPSDQSLSLIGPHGLYTVEHFAQIQTLKLVSLTEAQNDDSIRRREEAFEVEARRRERAMRSLAVMKETCRVGL